MEITTWRELASLTQEERESLTPEEIETLKKTIGDNELKIKEEGEKELKDSKDYGENQKIRAEKAEKAGKKKEEGKEEKSDLSSDDILALTGSDLHKDDITEVREYAKYKKITITEALEDKTLKGIIDQRVGERKTADATNTSKQPGGKSQVSGDTLLENARKGDVPDTDKGINDLVEAREKEKMGEKNE